MGSGCSMAGDFHCLAGKTNAVPHLWNTRSRETSNVRCLPETFRSSGKVAAVDPDRLSVDPLGLGTCEKGDDGHDVLDQRQALLC